MPSLTFERAQHIFELLLTYNLNFVVLHDRLEYDEYSIEDLKEVISL